MIPEAKDNTAGTAAGGGAASDAQAENVKVEMPTNEETPIAEPYPSDDAPANDNKEEKSGSAVPSNAKRLAAKGKEFIRANGGSCLVVVLASFFLMVEASISTAEIASSVNSFVAQGGVVVPSVVQEIRAYHNFAVAFSVITLFASGAYLVGERLEKLEEKPRLYISIFLLVWCIVGVCVITFKAPFTVTSNGYFATWATFFGAYHLLKSNVSQTDTYIEKLRSVGEHLAPLLISSLVELFAGIVVCSQSCQGTSGYAVAVGIVSFVICLGLALGGAQLGLKGTQAVVAFLCLWWIIAVFVLTFDSPFNTTGNGYFATWIAFGLSVMFLESVLNQ